MLYHTLLAINRRHTSLVHLSLNLLLAIMLLVLIMYNYLGQDWLLLTDLDALCLLLCVLDILGVE